MWWCCFFYPLSFIFFVNVLIFTSVMVFDLTASAAERAEEEVRGDGAAEERGGEEARGREGRGEEAR